MLFFVGAKNSQEGKKDKLKIRDQTLGKIYFLRKLRISTGVNDPSPPILGGWGAKN